MIIKSKFHETTIEKTIVKLHS
uniref:Uncharacterized protein n=1 Tax=Arundo donax TaxID=35708 RepID=A0A0A8Z5Z0_ARUDO